MQQSVYHGLFERIYEDNVSGKLSDDRFAKMYRRYEDEQKDLAEKNKQENDAEREKTVNLYVLQSFFLTPYEADRDFYEQFEERMTRAKEALA